MFKTKIKIKKPRKLTKLEIIIFCIISYLVVYYVGLPNTLTYLADIIGVEMKNNIGSVKAEIKVVEKEVIKEEEKEYTWVDAYAEMARNNINPVKGMCLVKHESGENCNAKYVNGPGSIDVGCYQWSSKWQIDPGYIDMACIGDLKCETKKFIEKVKNDGNFLAWHGYTKNCQWLGTNPFN